MGREAYVSALSKEELLEHFAISNGLLGGNDKDEKYPIITRSKHKRNRRREVSVGLLGLQPSRIDESTADESGFESIYTREDEF